MEYFAKSLPFVLSWDKKKNLIERLKKLIEELGDDLEQAEKNIIKREIDRLNKSSEETKQKSLKEHLDETVRCAEDFFKEFGNYFSETEKSLIISACRFHDIGKANLIFQNIINYEKCGDLYSVKQIPHGFLSALAVSHIIFDKENPLHEKYDYDIWLTAIYFHHTRDEVPQNELREFCEKYYLEHIRNYMEAPELKLKYSNQNNLLFTHIHSFKAIPETIWCRYMLVKGMLNKFDWTVSAQYDVAEMYSDRGDKKLCGNIERILSVGLKPAQKFMKDNCNNNVVMIAPTGSGKTEAALLWLNGEKGFYTLPLKVSSNSIYNRIRDKYEYANVALLHSDSMNVYIKDIDADIDRGYENYQRAKLLSYPLTVCTVDQIFKFAYKALGTEIFAATLKYSKVIIDEIQSYEPRIIAALLYALSEIKIMGGKFAIITATFPPVLRYFMEYCGLLEKRDYVYRDFSVENLQKRHKLRIEDGEMDIEKIVDTAPGKKILVICNTVGKAQEIYKNIRVYLDDLGIKENLYLLHSRFIRKHRSMLEKNIIDFSNDEQSTGIWVTTQIVEASLDIDFDILFTEMCTADSLLQRMGRCNRAGEKAIPNNGNVIIFSSGSGRGTVYDKDIFDITLDVFKKYDGCLLSETDKTTLINKVYDVNRVDKTKYFADINKFIKNFKCINPLDYDMKNVDEDFRKIENITVMPENVYIENREMVENIVSFLNGPYIEKSVRKILMDKLNSLTMGISIWRGRKTIISENIDHEKIGKTDIRRTSSKLRYEFDEASRTGRGLIFEEMDDDIFI